MEKLNKAEGKEQYHVEISNRFARLQFLKIWIMRWILIVLWKLLERIAEFLLKSYYELKKHNLWLDEGCSELIYQREEVKLQ
jgi:uncharacterized membrane protein